MTSKRKMTPAQKYERLDRQYSDFTAGSISIHSAWVGFIADQITKGNSKATIDFYNRFYKKLKAYVEQLGQPDTECPVEFLESDVALVGFIPSLVRSISRPSTPICGAIVLLATGAKKKATSNTSAVLSKR